MRSVCRRWRYTWEALGHIPNLRLFLFNLELDQPYNISDLKVELFSKKSLLVVKWKEEGAEEHELRVPVPKVLIDPDSLVQAFSMKDHIEVKLALVLPLDHPMFLDSLSVLDEGSLDYPGGITPAVESDLKSLSGDVHFYCKRCGTRLSSRPLRKFVDLPSADWRDAADNWFGGGCCSFGGISEKLVRAYIQIYSCAESTCLLDGSSVTISINDLEGYEFSSQALRYFPHSDNHYVHSMRDIAWDAIAKKTNNDECENVSHGACFDQVLSEESPSCCEESRIEDLKQTLGSASNQIGLGGLHDVILGSGFPIKAANLMGDVQWNEFSCRKCSSVLGCFPVVKNADYPIDGRIRLIKCYISTRGDDCSSGNVFRDCTIDRIFARLMMDNAENELSFHTLMKDLNSRAPLLETFLLNSKAWFSSGDCDENDSSGCHSSVDLQPVVKVLFSDNWAKTGVYFREFEHPEEVFLMNRQAKELLELLKLAHICLPSSCSTFQGMSLSYLKR